MINWLQFYLESGLVKHEFHNLELLKFIKNTSFEFNEWIEEVESIPYNSKLNKAELFEKFINEYQDYRKWLSQKRFTQWLNQFAKYKEITIKEGNTMGNRWVIFAEQQGSNELEPLEKAPF